jgi:hypothetical protein
MGARGFGPPLVADHVSEGVAAPTAFFATMTSVIDFALAAAANAPPGLMEARVRTRPLSRAKLSREMSLERDKL